MLCIWYSLIQVYWSSFRHCVLTHTGIWYSLIKLHVCGTYSYRKVVLTKVFGTHSYRYVVITQQVSGTRIYSSHRHMFIYSVVVVHICQSHSYMYGFIVRLFLNWIFPRLLVKVKTWIQFNQIISYSFNMYMYKCITLLHFLYARLQTGRIMVWWCPSVRHSFPHFSPTCFDIFFWNFVYH